MNDNPLIPPKRGRGRPKGLVPPLTQAERYERSLQSLERKGGMRVNTWIRPNAAEALAQIVRAYPDLLRTASDAINYALVDVAARLRKGGKRPERIPVDKPADKT